jgi:hypothetical protein
MAVCYTCSPEIPKDEALSIARKAAKDEAVRKARPVAIVQAESGFVLYDAFYAYEIHLIVKEVVSHL